MHLCIYCFDSLITVKIAVIHLSVFRPLFVSVTESANITRKDLPCFLHFSALGNPTAFFVVVVVTIFATFLFN